MPNPQPDIKPIKIGNHTIGSDYPVYIVAELSANHRQNFEEAVELIHAAKEAGADAVKLQTYTPDTMTIDCDNQRFCHGQGSLWEGKSLYRLYQKAYMPWEWQPKLKKVANDIGLDLFSSAYDCTSVNFLQEMEVPAIKIASFELVDLPLIRHAAKTGLPLIISTGMGTLEEIEKAVSAAKKDGCKELILLKCTSSYPTLPDEMNLKSIEYLKNTFQRPCGLSDHTRDIIAPVVATTIGACMIEKHFTLSRQNDSPDKGFSLEPLEFTAMAASIRMTEKMLGSVYFNPLNGEKESLSFRRSLYAIKDIQAEEEITAFNVKSIRPAGGLSPENLEDIIGRRAKYFISKGTPLTWDALEKL